MHRICVDFVVAWLFCFVNKFLDLKCLCSFVVFLVFASTCPLMKYFNYIKRNVTNKKGIYETRTMSNVSFLSCIYHRKFSLMQKEEQANVCVCVREIVCEQNVYNMIWSGEFTWTLTPRHHHHHYSRVVNVHICRRDSLSTQLNICRRRCSISSNQTSIHPTSQQAFYKGAANFKAFYMFTFLWSMASHTTPFYSLVFFLLSFLLTCTTSFTLNVDVVCLWVRPSVHPSIRLPIVVSPLHFFNYISTTYTEMY